MKQYMAGLEQGCGECELRGQDHAVSKPLPDPRLLQVQAPFPAPCLHEAVRDDRRVRRGPQPILPTQQRDQQALRGGGGLAFGGTRPLAEVLGDGKRGSKNLGDEILGG